MNTKPRGWLTLLCLTLVNFSARAAEELPLVTPKVKAVAAFKNGLGFVFKAAETPLIDGWARLDQVPSAALGTLWIGTTSKAGPVTDVIAYREKVFEERDANSQSELLEANVGRRVALTCYVATTPTRIEGTLLAVPSDREPDDRGLMPINEVTRGRWREPASMMRGEIVLLQSLANGKPSVLSVNKSTIQAVEMIDGSNLKAKVQKELARAKVRVGGNPASAEITVACLEKGIVWSPSYRLNIEKEKTADIALDAVLANDVEDLENVEVSFVVGYPNFLYADLLTPLSVQQSVANFIQSLMAGRPTDQYGRFANVAAQSVAYNTANFDASIRPETAYSVVQPLAGEVSEDLFFYKKAAVTLKRGDRTRHEIFNAMVPYEHVYQWDIPDSMNVDDRGYRQDQSNKKEPENQVWHMLRLENTSKQPWTTAPAFTMNGAMPLAQDVLNYTPPGRRNTLKLTVATDLRAEQTQTESSRKPVNIGGRAFDEVTVEGKLKVTNSKSKETRVVVRKSLTGEVLEARDGKVSKVVRKLTSVNPSSEIEWEFNLPAGNEKELSCQYKALVSR